jgi:hypothetical protein
MMDFEKYWQNKLAFNLEKELGKSTAQKIMFGSETIDSDSSGDEIIFWTQKAMKRLDEIAGDLSKQKVMLACACHYPEEELLKLRDHYRKTGNITDIHNLLQQKFENLLDTLGLSEAQKKEVIANGMGSAGIMKGNQIIATKIPKSGFLLDYLNEKDPVRRREMYCHCNRIRDAVTKGIDISETYCYCGAGFYQNIWETILEKPVKIELLESILKGDDFCKYRITI